MRRIKKNQQLTELLQLLRKTAIENNAAVWRRVASDLEKPTRKKRIVNIYKIEKYAQDNEVVVVPGKVLGTGELTKKVTVAAYNFSDEAYKKIKERGNPLSIKELLEKNPQGKKIRLMC